MAEIKDPENTVIIELKDGPVVIELLPDVAPKHAEREKHLAFLKAQPGLQMAGPLIEEGEMRGSLLIVEAETLTQVKDWAATDPYKAADLFASVEVIEWKKVIG